MGQYSFSIYVQNENEDEGKKEKIKVINEQSISVLKYILNQLYNIESYKFNLYYKDTLLDESKFVSFYGLKRGDVLTLKIKDGFKIDVEYEIGREKRKENFQITISANLLIKEIKNIINNKMHNLLFDYTYIYLNDKLLDDNKKNVGDYNITGKDKLKVIIRSKEPGEILIFISTQYQGKYGIFVNEEDKLGKYFWFFEKVRKIPEGKYYYTYNNYVIHNNATAKERGIKEFDELIMVPFPLYG